MMLMVSSAELKLYWTLGTGDKSTSHKWVENAMMNSWENWMHLKVILMEENS